MDPRLLDGPQLREPRFPRPRPHLQPQTPVHRVGSALDGQNLKDQSADNKRRRTPVCQRVRRRRIRDV